MHRAYALSGFFIFQILCLSAQEPINTEQAGCNAQLPSMLGRSVEVLNFGDRINAASHDFNSLVSHDGRWMLFSRGNQDELDRFNSVPFELYYNQFLITEKEGRLLTRAVDAEKRLDLFPHNEQQFKNTMPLSMSSNDEVLLVRVANGFAISVKQDSGFSQPIRLEIDLSDFVHYGNASLTEDGMQLYFSAKLRKNDASTENADIYMCKKEGPNSWSVPMTVAMINSDQNDDFPQISADGQSLFFSSNREGGLGGYDVYYSIKENGQWTQPINLCEPINSSNDDLYFRVSATEPYAYLTSNRPGGMGGYDLYKVLINRPDFNGCKQQPMGMLVTIDASASIDPRGAELEYLWEFGDGARGKGKLVEHLYKRPGAYTCLLNARDTKTGLIYSDQYVQPIQIVYGSGGALIDSKDTLRLNQKADFNANFSEIDGVKPDHFHWRFDDSVVHDSVRIERTFLTSHKEEVRLSVNKFNQGFLDVTSGCVTKLLVIE